MLSAQSISERIQQFVGGLSSLDDFEDWLISASWNMHQHADSDLQRLVGAVELRLAEYSADHLDVADLKHELSMLALYGAPMPAIQMPVFSFSFADVTTVSSTMEGQPAFDRVVMAFDRTISGETRSAASRTVTAREALELAV